MQEKRMQRSCTAEWDFACFKHKPRWIRLDFSEKISHDILYFAIWSKCVLMSEFCERTFRTGLATSVLRYEQRKRRGERAKEIEAAACDYSPHCFVPTTQKYPTCINEFLQSRTTTLGQWAKRRVTWEYSLPPQRLLHSFDDSYLVQKAHWEKYSRIFVWD